MSLRNRRDFLRAGGALAAAMLLHPRWADSASRAREAAATPSQFDEYELVTSPRRVFKVAADENREHMEGWLTTLILRTTAGDSIELDDLVVSYQQGDAERLSLSYCAEALRLVNLVASAPPSGAGISRPAFAMRFTALQPQAHGIDRAHCELTVRTKTRGRVRIAKDIPLESFQQQTRLDFPFRGRGLITQGGALNDGHRNRSGQFAVDAMALSDLYAVMARDGASSDSAAGWGHLILAPADGVVAMARSNRPDQPLIGIADPKYFAAEFTDGGDPGNHVVIDHENGEFSMIAHFQRDTLKVREGDRVTRGQPLGLLGSSGDSSAPHVHHQLQAGPVWTSVDGLPHHYENGPKRRHDRGTMFNAT